MGFTKQRQAYLAAPLREDEDCLSEASFARRVEWTVEKPGPNLATQPRANHSL